MGVKAFERLRDGSECLLPWGVHRRVGKAGGGFAPKANDMKLDGFNDLQIEVSDVDRSGRWYRRALGMRLLPPSAEGGGALLCAGGFRLRLVAGTPSRARQFRIGVRLDDRATVRRWRAHVDASGGFGNPIADRAGYYGFTVADPDGYLVEFMTDADEVSESSQEAP